MSTMVYPETLPPVVLAHVLACDQCEGQRRPRIFVCAYHEGWWDGWEAASSQVDDNTRSQGDGDPARRQHRGRRVKRRLYPFTEPVPPQNTATSGASTYSLRIYRTTYRRNPFRGVRRIVFAVDEWGHRTLGRFHRPLLGWLCDWWERDQGGPSD